MACGQLCICQTEKRGMGKQGCNAIVRIYPFSTTRSLRVIVAEIIYNMVMFYDEYSSETFYATVEKYLNSEFVQPRTAQIEAAQPTQELTVIVQPETAQMPKILELTTLTNHIEILCRCKSSEERMFYILYANKEHLVKRELQRCISNQTYTALLGSKNNMSKGLLNAYPNAPIMFKGYAVCRFSESSKEA